jgi:hypothetical protein
MEEKLILTKDQQKIADEIQKFLDESKESIFTLEGIAGTGKTTMLRETVRGRSNVIACCVSHVAKSVLLNNMGDVASCMTVAQMLGLKMHITEEGEIEFIPKKTNSLILLPVETADIIIIDEASMIDDETYTLVNIMKKNTCKIIYCGDPAQLPPISKKDKTDADSKAFNHTKAKLLKTLRYEGIISELGSRIRTEISKINHGKAGTKHLINSWCTEQGYSSRTSIVDDNGNGVVFLDNINEVVEIAKSHFIKEDVNELRLIGYRRASIDILNSVLRGQLYAADYGFTVESEDDEVLLPQFIKGELIISDGGYKDLIHNNQTFKVVDFIKVIGPLEIPCLALLLDPMPSMREGQQILVVDNELGFEKYQRIANSLKKNAKSDGKQWPAYYNFTQQFCTFEHSLAINAHRCQGSTYNNVIIFENDIMSITKNSTKAKLQSLYVACTRAKKRVYIYNKKYKIDQSLLPKSLIEELKLKI